MQALAIRTRMRTLAGVSILASSRLEKESAYWLDSGRRWLRLGHGGGRDSLGGSKLLSSFDLAYQLEVLLRELLLAPVGITVKACDVLVVADPHPCFSISSIIWWISWSLTQR